MRLRLLYPATPTNYKGELFPHISQHFGENLVPLYNQLGLKGHNGLDIFAPDGAPVYAAHDGIVTFTGEDGSGGLGVVIRTTEKFEHNGGEDYIKTIYWHLKKNSFLVKPGDCVKAGQQIASADNTGASSGSHLHFGMKAIARGEQDWQWENLNENNGYRGALNPEPYLYFNQKFPPMKLGQSSNDIARLQKLLKDMGFYEYDKITGFYGSITQKAVLDFQRSYKVAPEWELFLVNGRWVGPKTLEVLNNL